MREIRTLRAKRRGLETEPRKTLHGHEAGNGGNSQGEVPTLGLDNLEGRVSIARWNPKGLRRSTGP